MGAGGEGPTSRPPARDPRSASAPCMAWPAVAGGSRAEAGAAVAGSGRDGGGVAALGWVLGVLGALPCSVSSAPNSMC